MTSPAGFPVAELYAKLGAVDARWSVDVGRPSGEGWIAGVELGDAESARFKALLARTGRGMGTSDRLTVAASFALRFGWASAIAIAPYLRYRCVPDVSPENITLRFSATGVYERAAIAALRGAVVDGDPRAAHPTITTVPDDRALLRALRDTLVAQTAPVARALFDWSAFAERGTWGLVASAWATHFTDLWPDRRDLGPVTRILDELFAGDDVVARMRPRLTPLEHAGRMHLYQRRASCCRFYLLPGYGLCASCPLVSDDERLARNREWLGRQR